MWHALSRISSPRTALRHPDDWRWFLGQRRQSSEFRGLKSMKPKKGAFPQDAHPETTGNFSARHPSTLLPTC